MSSSDGSDWADTFASIARDLLAEPDVDHTLDRAVYLCREVIDGCQAAGVSITMRGRDRQRIETPAATDESVQRAHDLQYEIGEGPCLDAIWEHKTTFVDDLANDERWPTWGPRVVEDLGYASVLSLQLFNTKDNLGSLNLYSDQRGAFDVEAQQTGLVMAAHAAVALTGARAKADLEQAAETRLIIGQAEGMLMERLGMTAEQAFETLRRASNERNVKLRDIAREIVQARSGGRGRRTAT